MGSGRVGLLAAVLAVAALAAAAHAHAATYAAGIDVSHYQGSINWAQVAGTQTTFVYAKATEGTTLVDATYPINRPGAEGVGLRLGAYHFARPGGSGDAAIIANAIAQADFFLAVAQPQPGELPPALDLETNGGLEPADLVTWTTAWLDEIAARTGIGAAVYTSPNFWKNSLADSGVVALGGHPLWIAHWTSAAAPTVPAGNWNGKSWTFWQWSDNSHVAGIPTAVDGDRFHGSSPVAAVLPPYPGGAPAASAPPTIVGSAQTGKRLTAVPGSWTGGKPLTFTYQWQRCDASGGACTPIPGATAETYLPAAADLGHALDVAVTAQASGGSASAVSPATVAVASAGTTAARPVATTAPSIVGTAQDGQVLTSSVGAWSGSPTTFAYQWQRCSATGTQCTAILGATAASYTIGPADIGSTLALIVTATAKGGSASATTPPTSDVLAAPIPPAVVGSAVAAAGAAGAVSSADGRATVTWQPGAIPTDSTVSLVPIGKAIAFSVAPTVAQLPWPVDVALAATNGDVVGYSPDGVAYRPAPALGTSILPATKQAGTYVDSANVTHVLLRQSARIELFTPGGWGDPRLVSAGPPKARLVGRLHVARLRSGAVVVTGRVLVPSQALLTINVAGKTSARRTRLTRPGGVSVHVAIAGSHLARGALATLRVAAKDPYGRAATLLVRFRAP